MFISAPQLYLSEGLSAHQKHRSVGIFSGAKVTVWTSESKLSEILILRRLKASQAESRDINGRWPSASGRANPWIM